MPALARLSSLTRIATLALAAGAAIALQTDCATFPALSAGVCGNAVVESGEDCDTYAPSGMKCRPPSDPLHCRFDCTAGSNDACPSGWGCGSDGICRQPSGHFDTLGQKVFAGAWRVLLGDFNGDGVKDALTREQVDGRGYSRLRIHYFAADGTLQSTLIPSPLFADPGVADVDGDGLSDLVVLHATERLKGVDVLLGQADGTLSPVAYPAVSNLPAGVSIRLLAVKGVVAGPGLAAFVAVNGQAFFGHIDQAHGSFLSTTGLPGGPDQMLDEPVSGHFVETNRCPELVFAYDTATTPSLPAVTVVVPCVAGGINWSIAPAMTTIALPPNVNTDRGVRVGDVNGDGHLDLLAGGRDKAAERTFVAYGDGKGGFFADLMNPSTANTMKELKWDGLNHPLPLAVGELSGDAFADYVADSIVYTSFGAGDGGVADAGDGGGVDGGGGAGTPLYFTAFTKSGTPWTSARVADLNNDGLNDVIAGSDTELDLSFLNGTGMTYLYPFTVPTTGVASHFAVADYDGDLVQDLAFAQPDNSGDGSYDVAIAYGRSAGAPESPLLVGNVGQVVQVVPSYPSTELTVVSTPVSAAPDGGLAADAGAPGTGAVSIYILANTGDRQPLSSLALEYLTNPSDPMSVQRADALGLTLVPPVPAQAAMGAHPNLVTLGVDVGQGVANPAFHLFPIQTAGVADLTVGPPSAPVGSTNTVVPRTAILMTAGDIDHDGVVETILVTPGTADPATGLLMVTKPGSDGTLGVVNSIPIPAPISETGQLGLADVTGDGAPDVVLLTQPGRAFYVWKNGGTGFAAGDLVPVNPTMDYPQGFALLRVTTAGATLAYATPTAIKLAKLDPSGTSFSTTQPYLDDYKPSAITGIAAGDIDGDGVDDIALADSGNLVLLHGHPVLP